MKCPYTLSLAALLGCWMGTVLAEDNPVLTLPVPAGQEPVIHVIQEPAPAAAPATAPTAKETLGQPCTVACCPADCARPCRCRKERFTLYDYWEILKAFFYCE